MLHIYKFVLIFAWGISLIHTVAATSVTCGELKTTYNDKQCCTNSNAETCLRYLPSCTDSAVVAGQICTDINGNAFVKGLAEAFDLSSSTSIILKKHIIPDTNAAYDLGNAEYKIRYLFESSN